MEGELVVALFLILIYLIFAIFILAYRNEFSKQKRVFVYYLIAVLIIISIGGLM